MPVLPSSITAPLWEQFHALIPRRQVAHPLGCHRPRVPDRVVFDKLLARLVLGDTYQQHADHQVSATTLRSRRDEWIAAGVFEALHQAALEAYDQAIGLDLDNLAVDGCIVKAPAAGRTPAPRLWTAENRGPNDRCWSKAAGSRSGARSPRQPARLAAVTPHFGDPWALRLPSARPDHGAPGLGLRLAREPQPADRAGLRMADHPKGAFLPINHTRRWVVERTNSWHTRGFKSLAIVTDRRAVVQAAWVALAARSS